MMKRVLTTLTLAVAMMVVAIPAAAANSVNSNDTAGAGTEDCRPGPKGNDLISGWEPIEKIEYINEVIATVPTDHPEYDYIVNVVIPNSADATWEFCDKNRDETLCVMRTVPSPYGWLLLDNRPFTTR